MALPPRVSVCTFLSTPSARRATSVWMVFMSELQNFYPRPPRGGRQSPCGRACNPRDFYPRPPRGGRLSTNGIPAAAFRFLSTPSARRATKDGNKKGFEWQISIHALREEGDTPASTLSGLAGYFYPRPPRGGRPPASTPSGWAGYFYPRPPRGGRLAIHVPVSDCI